MIELNPKLNSLPLHEKKWLQALVNYINQANSKTNLSANHLAKYFIMSERQFYRKVKRISGQTPNQIVRSIKMKKAKDFLEKGTYPTIAELAYDLGYKHPEYFSNLFTTTYGKRPSNFLKNSN